MPFSVKLTATALALAAASASVLVISTRSADDPPLVPLTEAPTAALAMAAAQRQGTLVEALDQRAEDRTVWAKPDGALTAELDVEPVRVRKDGGWVAPNADLERRPDGVVAPKAAALGIELSGGGTTPVVSLANGDKRFSLTWPGKLPEPKVDGKVATYADVLPGVDLNITADVTGYRQYLVINTAEAAKNPALRRVKFGLRTQNLAVEVGEDGSLIASDSAGVTVFEAAPSQMWDSAPRQNADDPLEGRSPVGVELTGDSLTVVPDEKALADPNAVFPIVVDPSLHTADKQNWTSVYDNGTDAMRRGTHWDGANSDPETKPWLQGMTTARSGRAYGQSLVVRTYFQFDTSFLAGRQILGSTLNASELYGPSCDLSHRHSLYAAGRIDGGTNWYNQPGGGWLAAADVGSTWDRCQGWRAAGWNAIGGTNAGGLSAFYLRADDEGDQNAWRKFHPNTNLRVDFDYQPNNAYDLGIDQNMTPCHWCGGDLYVAGPLVDFRARLSDPDDSDMFPKWQHSYAGAPWTETVGGKHSTQSPFTYQIDVSERDNQAIAWRVKGSDGHWDSPAWIDGPSFRVDRVAPKEARVSSPLYPEDNRWHGGTGVAGTFFLQPAVGDTDIDHFAYGWDSSTTETVLADKLGGNALLSLAPIGDGPRDLYVSGVDRAGNKGPAKIYHFYVRAGVGPIAQYTFDGNTKDSAYLGSRDGTLNGDAPYVAGALGSALKFDGTGDSVTAPNAVHTDASFSVSAWVKLDNERETSIVVSQESGRGFPDMLLWYRSEENNWAFGLPWADLSGTDFAVAPGRAALNTWTHLTGVFDVQSREIKLYVNGELVKTATRTGPDWYGAGKLRVGYTQWDGREAQSPFRGVIDEVRLYDRVLGAVDVRAEIRKDNVQLGHWKFDEQDGAVASNEVRGGDQLVLADGASFTPDAALQNAAKGALSFDGTRGYAQTTGPVVRTDRGFSVGGWVKLDQLAPTGKSYTVISQDGTTSSGFEVFQRDGKWQFGLREANGSTAWNLLATSTETATTEWTHLTAVFDAGPKKGYLYVNGGTPKEAVGTKPLWDATGKLAFGRAQRSGDVDLLDGKIDDWRAYSRVLGVEEIRGIVAQDGVTAGTWKLDRNVEDAAVPGRNGTEHGDVTWSTGQSSSPDADDYAARFTGSANLSAPKTINTSRSFSVSAWAKLDKIGGHPSVLSLDGDTTSAFQLQATPEGRWAFAMFSQDVSGGGPEHYRAIGGQAQVGVWTHLVAGYDETTKQMSLYVNGVLAATATNNSAWNKTTGRLQIGRAMWGGAQVDYFTGSIDDVSVYTRPLFADEIRQMAGRDLSLVHQWQLDESTGSATSDSVGTRSATFTGGATHAPGRLGNAVSFDGTGSVSTQGVDLRTDDSFAVSAFVKLPKPSPACDYSVADVCKWVALSIDGNNTSKFRLGYFKDDGQNANGKWFFEMPESDAPDATITKAAVTTLPSELEKWVHLTGVYDSKYKKLWLYVDGTRIGDGTLNNPWQGGGGLQIGRGKAAGNPAEHWKGSVDEVRVYTGALDDDRVSALFKSYPPNENPAPTLPVADKGHWKFNDNTGTTAVDSSGRNQTATLKGGAGWIGGRTGQGAWFDGTSGYAETTSAVLDTKESFSVSAWVYLNQKNSGNRVIVGQDGNRVSAFSLMYQGDSDRWAAVLATNDKDNADTMTVQSTEPAALSDWTHLTMSYDKARGQLRLYVNGMPSGTKVGVTTVPSTGPLSMGRAKSNGVNSAFFPRGVDDVRVFGKALTDGEARKVHDDAPTTASGQWRFNDGTVRDYSWRNNPTSATGSPTFVDGVDGKSLRLDGSSWVAADWSGVTMRDSFTVSAWVNFAGGNKVATVLGQDGNRMSGFALQYRPESDRWAFGAPIQDADAAPMVWAASVEPPKVNQWQHLIGVYDRAAGVLKLYVDGKLVGTRDNVALWATQDRMTIGRGKVAGAAADLFTGGIDEVKVENGILSDQDIARRSSYPAPAAGQLGRLLNSRGDHYTAGTGAPLPEGYHFEGTLGFLVDPTQPNTRTLYACLFQQDAFTSVDVNCEGQTKLGVAGVVYGKQPTNVPTIPVYRCNTGPDHFESRDVNCEGKTKEGILGYTNAYAPLVRSINTDVGDHFAAIDGTPPGYRTEGVLGYTLLVAKAGTQSLMSCYDGADQFVSTDANCDGKQVVGSQGRIYSAAPTDVETRALYRCKHNGQSFVSSQSDCEGTVVDKLLGYVEKSVPTTAPVFPTSVASTEPIR